MSRNASILLMDDDTDLRHLVKVVFEFEGYCVETAANGLEGLEMLKTFKPDLIVLDMNMPKMGGLEFYHNICDSAGRPRFPVIILTARANVNSLSNDLMIKGLMTKPFEIDELLKKVRTVVGQSHHSGIIEREKRT